MRNANTRALASWHAVSYPKSDGPKRWSSGFDRFGDYGVNEISEVIKVEAMSEASGLGLE